MPKKFTPSERKKALQKETENESSSSSSREERDKIIKKKQQRKEEQNKKREMQLARKAETKKLLEEETDLLKAGKMSSQKFTRAQIRTTLGPVTKSVKPIPSLQENVNRAKGEEMAARSVDEAISVLKDKEAKDKHPEKRRKTAFANFEKRRIKEGRNENPELKLSQVREMVFKEWQKSPENPMNQV